MERKSAMGAILILPDNGEGAILGTLRSKKQALVIYQ